jgi:hypothetical protein
MIILYCAAGIIAILFMSVIVTGVSRTDRWGKQGRVLADAGLDRNLRYCSSRRSEH